MNLSIDFGGLGGRIQVDCPHVENGACSTCLEPLLAEAVKGRSAQHALASLEKVVTENIRAMALVRRWIRRQQRLEWRAGPEKDVGTGGGT